MKLRSGVTDSSTNYNIGKYAVVRSGAGSTVIQQSASTNGWEIIAADQTFPGFGFASIDLSQPFATQSTSLGITGHTSATAGNLFGQSGGGIHDIASSYDGINLISSSGNITGSVQVFGYNK